MAKCSATKVAGATMVTHVWQTTLQMTHFHATNQQYNANQPRSKTTACPLRKREETKAYTCTTYCVRTLETKRNKPTHQLYQRTNVSPGKYIHKRENVNTNDHPGVYRDII